MGTFQMPEFNFRLRRALDPFGSQESGRKFGGVSFFNPQQDEEESTFDTRDIPPFRRSMPDYSQMYEETGPATQRYQSHLSEVPNLKDYAPTKWRRLGAVLTGINQSLGGKDGYSAARNVVLDPYKTAYEDWMGRGAGLKESATLEEAAANKKAQVYQKILSDYMDSQDKNFDREVRWGTLANAQEQTKIQQKRAEIEADRVAGVITNAEARNEIAKLGVQQTGRYQQGMLGLGQKRLEEDRRQGLDRAATGWYNAQTGRQRADVYGDYLDRPSYSPAADMQRFEMDATREFLALNPTLAEEVELDNHGRINYESIDDPAIRTQIMDAIKRGVANKQRASMRPGR